MEYGINDHEKEKSSRITEIAVVISLIVSILVFVTNLLSNSGNVPSWWFYISLIVLVVFMLFVPIMFFSQPINEQIQIRKKERKRNAIARKYASEFKDLVFKTRDFDRLIPNFFNVLNNHYKDKITSQLCSHIMMESFYQNRTESSMQHIENDIDNSKTYHELVLVARHFELVLNTYQRSLKQIELFIYDMILSEKGQVPKGISDDFEAFREKYNHHINNINEFFHKINREIDRFDFPEHFELLKKW